MKMIIGSVILLVFLLVLTAVILLERAWHDEHKSECPCCREDAWDSK